MNNNLVGIVIDPGHGGTDSGAIGSDLYEKDYNLLISKYMADRFKDLGIPVTLTRDSDIALTPTQRVNNILSAYGNNPNVIVVSNHLNAGGGTGSEVIYALRNNDTLAKKTLENIGNVGINTRKIYQRRLPSDNSKDYYFIHRQTGNTEPIIVEYGFIDNDKDKQFLTNNYKQLAEAVIKAILDYKGIKYTAPDEVTTNVYKVIKGDTLYSIASKYGISVANLKTINNLTSNDLKVGTILKIPQKTMPADTSNLYTVKSGDTIYTIAKKYNTTSNKIKELNNLTNDTLLVGSIIQIPTLESTYKKYIVKKGDSLYSIAKANDTSVDKLKSINNLTSNVLKVGDILYIEPENNDNNVYTVKSGDTLYGIAKKFNISVNLLKSTNDLTSNMLSVGDKLIIPEETVSTYRVVGGDNLYKIAREFNTTVSELKRLNNLTSNDLQVGMLLLVK